MAVNGAEGDLHDVYDVIIVGGGIAGLSVALRLAAHKRVALLTKGVLGESNTRYAQGGVAVAMGTDDNPELHFIDTMAAGAGLCDEEAVRVLVEQGPAAVRWLIELGVQFDSVPAGSGEHVTPEGLLLGREGAHSRWRVLHANGDATGAEIERALTHALSQHSSITVYEETFVQQLLMEDSHCTGMQALDRTGQALTLHAPATILASGGAGGLWLHTSNPVGATADGLAQAWQAGAALVDLEFMQFHPTVLVTEGTSHLISEAVRGEGAYLRNHAGERFMLRYSEQAELAPRDVVARAILSEMVTEQTDCQYLDLRHLPADKMHARFPNISAVCRQQGLDIARDLLPIAPAAHYCMGGVMVDTYGRTTVAGLYAVGEVACTGVHGANRLASNSLLEGLVYGVRVADYITEQTQAGMVAKAMTTKPYTALISVDTVQDGVLSCGSEDVQTTHDTRREVRELMWQYVSLSRSEEGLVAALRRIRALRRHTTLAQQQKGPAALETSNMLQVAELVVLAALQRRESRGSHWRLDYQASEPQLAQHHYAFQRSHASNDRTDLLPQREEHALYV